MVQLPATVIAFLPVLLAFAAAGIFTYRMR